jgi:hypothetical protein
MLKVGVKIPSIPRQLFGNAQKIMQSAKDPAIGITLTPEQRDKWAIYRGKGIKKELASEMASGEYKATDARGRRAQLAQIFSDHGQDAQDRLLDEFPELDRQYDDLMNKRDDIGGAVAAPTAPTFQ